MTRVMRSLANLEIAVWLKAVKGMSSYPTCSCCHHLSPPSYSLHHLRHDNRFASLFKKKRGVCLHTHEVSCDSDGAECKPGGDDDDNYCNGDGNHDDGGHGDGNNDGDDDDGGHGDGNDDDGGGHDDDGGLPAHYHTPYSHQVGICHDDKGWECVTVIFLPYMDEGK